MKALLPSSALPRIVIIGGGFGGISFAQGLDKAPFQIVMLDKHNYHTFQPLLYQVATGGLEPDSIAFPLRKMFNKQPNLVFRVAEVTHIDTDLKCISSTIGEIDYDFLVLATGSVTNFFGMEDIATNAQGMKSIPESLNLRSLILQNFEEALEKEGKEKEQLMKFVVVGGGPTGVETAGALAELQRHILPMDYPELDLTQMEVHLLEAGPNLLAGMSEKSSKNAKKDLEQMGVNVRTGVRVKGFDGEKVDIMGEVPLEAKTMIWAAGVQGNPISGMNPTLIGRGKRVIVDEYLQVKGLKDVFAVGDLALVQTEASPHGHPQVAPAAVQQGEALAKNFLRKHKGAPLLPFEYFDKGSMATIGRNRAVLDFRKLHLKGRIAWLGWMFVHLLFLIGFRNKLIVFINWVWSYLTYDKGNRLIIRPFIRNRKNLEPVPAAELS